MNKTYIIVATILGLSILGCGLMVTNQKNKIFEAEQNRIRVNQTMLSDCLKDTQLNYTANWNRNCEMLKQETDCSLPGYLAESTNEARDKEKDYCLKRYPIE